MCIILQLNLVSQDLCSVCLTNGDVDEIHSVIHTKLGLNPAHYYLKSGGKIVHSESDVGNTVQVIPRLCGGKGGFGSMLRAIGAQIEKTTNREACRDLSGRRLRDINEEQRLKKWISQQADREKEIEERKKKKLERLSKQPKHEFKDSAYDRERADLTEKLYDAVEQGLKMSKGPTNQASNVEVKSIKKKNLLMDFEDDLSSSSSGEEESEDLAFKGGEEEKVTSSSKRKLEEESEDSDNKRKRPDEIADSTEEEIRNLEPSKQIVSAS